MFFFNFQTYDKLYTYKYQIKNYTPNNKNFTNRIGPQTIKIYNNNNNFTNNYSNNYNQY